MNSEKKECKKCIQSAEAYTYTMHTFPIEPYILGKKKELEKTKNNCHCK